MSKTARIIMGVVVLLLATGALVRKNMLQQPAVASEFDRSISNLVITKHARCRMDCRHIDESEIREILQHGTVNAAKSEPDGKPDPKYALEGTTHDGQEVRIVFAPSGQKMVVVTVIDLGKEWVCDCN